MDYSVGGKMEARVEEEYRTPGRLLIAKFVC